MRRLPDAQRPIHSIAWRDGVAAPRTRPVAEETPIALTYQRATHAVMLATPDDLEDFAIGFSLSEGIITDPAQIEALEVVALPDGIELRMDLADDRLAALTRRQRRIAGPSGCGLCGMDSLSEAIRPAPRVTSSGPILVPEAIATALDTLWPAQRLNQATRAAHAAGFWNEREGLIALREDIGRHNALDKLVGAMARRRVAVGDGVLLLSSRVSLEMAQKAAIMGAPVIVAVSAPTALAIDVAEACGITLIGIARADGFEVFTHPERIQTRSGSHVA